MYDIIVVGAGPAGMTAGLYALRANKSVLLLDPKGYGGQIVNAHKLENYPGIPETSGFDYATALYSQVKKLGGVFKREAVLRVEEDKKVVTNKDTYEAKAVIIATGAQNRKLNLEKEPQYIGKGVSYCAICDGNFYKNKVVAVNGGGNTALEDAIYLADLAKKVYVIHRRDTFRGEKQYLDELQKKDNVEFVLNANIVDLMGGELLEGIKVKQEDKECELAVDGLFIAIGQEPQGNAFANVVDVNEGGYMKACEDVFTRTEGIFVAGDAREKELRQLTTAVGDGSIAATMAVKFLNERN